MRVVAGGVVAFGRARGRNLDGGEIDVPVIWIFKLEHGLVTSARVTNTAPV